MAFNVTVGKQGRLVLPAKVRRKLGITPGQKLIGEVHGGRVTFESADEVINRLQEKFKKKPGEGSAVDKLIRMRREEAAREIGQGNA